MKKYSVVLFDLDGTLSDPKVGITKSVQYALQKIGIVEENLNKLETFIGPPLQVHFEKYMDWMMFEYSKRLPITVNVLSKSACMRIICMKIYFHY